MPCSRRGYLPRRVPSAGPARHRTDRTLWFCLCLCRHSPLNRHWAGGRAVPFAPEIAIHRGHRAQHMAHLVRRSPRPSCAAHTTPQALGHSADRARRSDLRLQGVGCCGARLRRGRSTRIARGVRVTARRAVRRHDPTRHRKIPRKNCAENLSLSRTVALNMLENAPARGTSKYIAGKKKSALWHVDYLRVVSPPERYGIEMRRRWCHPAALDVEPVPA